MENMTASLAKVLIIAAVLRLVNIIEFTTVTQLGFTIAAMLITVGDLKEFKDGIFINRIKDRDTKKDYKKQKYKTINGYHTWAVFFMVAFPNIRFGAIVKLIFPEKMVLVMYNFFSWFIANISDFSTLFALGLAIYTMSYKKNQRYLEAMKNTNGLTVIDGNSPTSSRGEKDVK